MKKISIIICFLIFFSLLQPVCSTADIAVSMNFTNPVTKNLTIPVDNNQSVIVLNINNSGPNTANMTVAYRIPSEIEIKRVTTSSPSNWRATVTKINETYYRTIKNATVHRFGFTTNIYFIPREPGIYTIPAWMVNSTENDPNLSNNNDSLTLIIYKRYADYFVENGYLYLFGEYLQYKICTNNSNETKWTRYVKTTALASIQEHTIFYQNKEDMKLYALSKYTGNLRWSLELDKLYKKSQLIGGKYLVLMDSTSAVMINLYSHKAVWGKTYPNATNYSVIKSKTNGNYYVMIKTKNKTKYNTTFFKLNTN